MRNAIAVFAAAACAATLFGACARSSVSEPGDRAAFRTSNGFAMMALTSEPQRWRHDPYQLISARIQADTLIAEVSYSGGCATHDFTLLIAPVFMESLPVQMAGSLAHDAKGDNCRAAITSTLRFELTPLRDLYQRSYGPGSATIQLNLRDWPLRLEYRFYLRLPKG
jgi:hypothetical protein